MATSSDLDLPIALRRSTRRCVSAAAALQVAPPAIAAPKTPRAKKRVRFSDPGPELCGGDEATSSYSTGLTPMIRRSSLGESSSKRRRSARLALVQDAQGEQDAEDIGLTAPKPKTKARARKAGGATKAEIELELARLRAELVSRDAEIERLRDETVAQDTARILELEEQILVLRAELQEPHSTAQIEGEDEGGDASDDDDNDVPSRTFYDWTLAPEHQDWDKDSDGDDGSGDITMTDVAFSTPSRRRKNASAAQPRSLSASFPTPPCTSPAMPATPFSVRKPTRAQTPSNASVHGSLPDDEKESLKAELESLRFELAKLNNTLEAQRDLQARLAEKLTIAAPPAPGTEGSEGTQPELEEHLNLVLKQLQERTVTLLEVNSSLRSLGFNGSEASEIIGDITSCLRRARLEIEYVRPGELSLPLSYHGAELLNLVLDHVRELSRQASENEQKIDEYHAQEFLLREQLGARLAATNGMREKLDADAAALRERDAHISDLEDTLERVKGATAKYQSEIRELESWVERIDSEGKLAKAKAQIDLDVMQERLEQRDAVAADLEAKLANALEQSEALEAQLRDFQLRREGENKARNRSHGAVLALKDQRILTLRREIGEINMRLLSAHESVIKLQRENVVVAERWQKAEDAASGAREAVEKMKAEMQKVTAAAAAAEKRRKHDSGVGLPEGDEDEAEAEL
ncbi:hypothetical protein F5X97DRAFT_338593 [Nemania serpens]|nr:hypothetical protein F5X97DRAFT_338593 [Nemania serpens]